MTTQVSTAHGHGNIGDLNLKYMPGFDAKVGETVLKAGLEFHYKNELVHDPKF